MLGHRSIQTTINFYIALEMIGANEIFAEIVKERLDKILEPANEE
jgi:hypothetical protein